MDIFVRNLPDAVTSKDVKEFFQAPFAECGIDEDYHAEKFDNKPLAILTVLHIEKAQSFLSLYGIPSYSPSHVHAAKRLFWRGKAVLCCKGRKDSSPFHVRSLALEASQRAESAANGVITRVRGNTQNAMTNRFAIQGLKCGVWDHSGARLAFLQHFADGRQGMVSFGRQGAVIVLGGSRSGQHRVDFNYYDCRNIVFSTNYGDPTISITLKFPPKFYEVKDVDNLSAAMMAMVIGQRVGQPKKATKYRLNSINDEHAKVAGTCFVYRLTLSDNTNLSRVRNLLSSKLNKPTIVPLHAPTLLPQETLDRSFVRLTHDLTDTRHYGNLPFSLRYQVFRLARNGKLPPLKVLALLPTISRIFHANGLDASLSAMTRFYHQVPTEGPGTGNDELALPALVRRLEELVALYEQFKYSPQNAYELVKRYQHINLIHKIVITPAATYLVGPEPEPTNRVLRLYADHSDHFVRVVFQEEDGGSVRYDPRADQSSIFHERFEKVLDGGLLIAGRGFSFLGFSHSSLRAQSCWFMAPIFLDGGLMLPEHILRKLGDFSNIRVPAKCAARIGQNFTDTNATIDLDQDTVAELDPVVRNDRDFGDGVGTISEELLYRVWRLYGTRRLLKPTALQIRFQGYKGMVSLDSRLPGDRLMLRSNMRKFETTGSWNLEICGAAFKPLPMILNRQLIKILEDLGVPENGFLELQRDAFNQLRCLTTTSAINSASFLEEMDIPRATQVPSLIRLLNQIGLDYRVDSFLNQVVEMAVVTKLRDVKYRARIPVPQGHTLYGIMDETGYLGEGEVYVVSESPPVGGRRILVKDRVAITRSPAMHPGDVQVVNAVDVPEESPLKQLSNVIVFSQHGQRDLPSQLSGGDLDGDLYNVIFDDRLIPKRTEQAADYTRVAALELDRPVTRKDMSDFFVKFMESDQLGMLCNIHMQLADQHMRGTFDEACIELAKMASTAVDFSKTGIPVVMKLPDHDRNRPDFMAPSPRVRIVEGGHIAVEEEEDDGDDDPAFEGLDPEKKSIRYYKSEKVLGQLYRAIDEHTFLAKMQHAHQALTSSTNTQATLLDDLLRYLKRVAVRYAILFDHHLDLARDIRANYEDSLREIIHIYAPSFHMPLSEHEVFSGTILGRKGGAQNKTLRDMGKTMRQRFDTIVQYAVMRIVKGDEQMQGIADLDLLYEEDGSLDREVEGLPRAIACLSVAVEETGASDWHVGEFQSFRYVAAAICLSELERYSITTSGSSLLPRI